MLFRKVHVFRVKPQAELVSEITNYCQKNGVSSGIIIGIIGSVANAQLNFLTGLPAKYETVEYRGPLEIVCAQGSIALKNDTTIIHIHILISGKEICRGGHLAKAIVFSTAEVVIGELDYQLKRRLDSYTGLNELIE